MLTGVEASTSVACSWRQKLQHLKPWILACPSLAVKQVQEALKGTIRCMCSGLVAGKDVDHWCCLISNLVPGL